TGPVMAAYPSAPAIDALIANATVGPPAADALEGNTRHSLWVVRTPSILRQLNAAFDALPAVYIADGHHRTAAAHRIAKARRAGRRPNREASHERFLIAVFPEHELRI